MLKLCAMATQTEPAKVSLQKAPYTCLIFDCGTGETKLMRLQYFDDGPNGAHVEVTQLSKKLPAVSTFLSRTEKPADNFAFLMEDARPADPDAVLEEQHFVQYCLEQRKLNGAKDVVIGCSAWYRADHREADKSSEEFAQYMKATALIKTLTLCGFQCRILHEKMESYFEAAAVAYAYSRMLGREELPAGCLSGGSGSSQFAHEFSRFLCIERGNKKCKVAMNKLFEEQGNFEAAFQLLDEFANGTADCEVSRHIAEQKASTASELPDDDERRAFAQPLSGVVVLISACYYAAVEVGLANKDNTMKSFPAELVIERMRAKVEEYKALLTAYAEDPKANPLPLNRKGKPSRPIDILLPIVNLTLHSTLYGQLFDVANTELIFKRDWEIGEEKFRTTWTSGWFLNHISEKFNLQFPGSKVILRRYQAWRKTCPNVTKYEQSPIA